MSKSANRKSREQFIKDISIIRPDVELLGDYINSKTKTLFRCQTCGNEWETTPGIIIAGCGCPKCSTSKRMKAKSHEDFERDILSSGLQIEFIDRYVNYKTRLRVKCLLCGNIWETSPDNLRHGYGCPKCFSRRGKGQRKSHESFMEEMEKVHPTITVLGTYTRADTKLPLRCNDCGYEWESTPARLLNRRSGCPECRKKAAGERDRFPYETFAKTVAENSPDIEIISEYHGLQNPIMCRCTECGTEWRSLAGNLYRGKTSCPNCNGRHRRTPEEFKEELSRINSSVTVLEDFHSLNRKISCKCNRCGNIWSITPTRLLQGQGCPMCAHSGTSFVEQFLFKAFAKALGIDNVRGRYREAIGVELDIYIPSLKVAIEPGAWAIHKRKIRSDFKKMILCKDNGITLYSIYFLCNEGYENEGNVFFYKNDLATESMRGELKDLVYTLFRKHGINRTFTEKEWREIADEAHDKSRKYTTEEFAERVYERNKEIEIIGQYKGVNTKIKCRCIHCGHTWNANPQNIMSGSRCPKCYGSVKKTREQLIEELKPISKYNTRVVGDYKTANTPIECECLDCGHHFMRPPHSLLKGNTRCPACFNKNSKTGKTPEEIPAGSYKQITLWDL